jgi:hypothetical protein
VADLFLPEDHKTCITCHEVKPLDAFALRRDTGTRRNVCKACKSARMRAQYAGNPEPAKRRARAREIRKPEEIKAWHREYRKRHPDRVRGYARKTYQLSRKDMRRCFAKTLDTKRNQAKKKGFELAITADDLVAAWNAQDGICALTGWPMVWGQDGHHPHGVSIDRIDQKHGYVPGNIRLAGFQANRARSEWSDDEFLDFCRSVIATIGSAPRNAVLECVA